MPPKLLARFYWIIGILLLVGFICHSKWLAALPIPFADDGGERWIVAAAIFSVLATLLFRMLLDAVWGLLTGSIRTFRLYVQNPEIEEQGVLQTDVNECTAAARERLESLSFVVTERPDESGGLQLIINKSKITHESGMLFSAYEGIITFHSEGSATRAHISLRLLGSVSGTIAADYQRLQSLGAYLLGLQATFDSFSVPITIDMAFITCAAIGIITFTGHLQGKIILAVVAADALAMVMMLIAWMTLVRSRATTIGRPAAAALSLCAAWPPVAHVLQMIDPRCVDSPKTWWLAAALAAPLLALPISRWAGGAAPVLPSRVAVAKPWQGPSRRKIFGGAFLLFSAFFLAGGIAIVISGMRMHDRSDVDLHQLEWGKPFPAGWGFVKGWTDRRHFVWHKDEVTKTYYLPMHGFDSRGDDDVAVFVELPAREFERGAPDAHESSTGISGILSEEDLPGGLEGYLADSGIHKARRIFVLHYHGDPWWVTMGGLASIGVGALVGIVAIMVWRWKGKPPKESPEIAVNVAQ